LSVDFRYIRIASKIWQDDKFRAISDEAKLLFLYILTSQHSNMIGYYLLPKPYVAYDLKWLPEQLDKRFSELLQIGLIKYCDKGDVVLIPNFLKYNTIQNPNQAKGAVNRLKEVPQNTLVDEFLACIKEYAEPFVEEFKEALPQGYGNTVSASVTDTVSVSASERACEDEPDDDDERKLAREITDAFTETFAYPPNSTQMQMLTSFLDDGLTPWHITEALKRSAEAGAKSPGYTKTILQDWINKKAFTPEDVDRLDKLRQPKSRDQDRKFTREDFTFSEPPKPDPQLFPFLAAVTKEDDADAEQETDRLATG
jgi:DnaD/phage-associated family protein